MDFGLAVMVIDFFAVAWVVTIVMSISFVARSSSTCVFIWDFDTSVPDTFYLLQSVFGMLFSYCISRCSEWSELVGGR